MSNKLSLSEQQYEDSADADLKRLQGGEISYHEWNQRQRELVSHLQAAQLTAETKPGTATTTFGWGDVIATSKVAALAAVTGSAS